MTQVELEFTRRLWGFLHLLHDPAGFESWIARHPELRDRLGDEIYGALVVLPRPNTPSEYKLRERLYSWARSSSVAGCPCSTWADDQRVALGFETATLAEDWFKTLKSRTPWLHLVACNRCRQYWYMGVDTVDDQHFFIRLTHNAAAEIMQQDRWPTNFDTHEHLWPDPRTSESG